MPWKNTLEVVGIPRDGQFTHSYVCRESTLDFPRQRDDWPDGFAANRLGYVALQ